MKKRGGIGSMGSGKPTARPKATGRTVYKSRTTIPTRRVAKPTAKKQKSPYTLEKVFKNQRQSTGGIHSMLGKATAKTKPQPLQISKPPTTQTPRQKAIAAVKARANAKKAAILKKYNSLTPLQRASMAQTQRARAKATTGNLTSAQSARKAQMLAQAKALATKQMQATNKATPTKTTGTLGNPTSAQKKIIKNNSNTAMQKAKPLSAPQKQMPRKTASVSDRLKKIVGSTVARRRAAAIARRKAAAMARRKAAVRTVRRPTGRTVYKSRTTIPTRRRRK